MPASKKRSISEIALEISALWQNVHFSAVPYLSAMRQIQPGQTMYMNDTVDDVILRFLSNSQHWRGEDARRIKTELKTHLNNVR